MFPKYLLLLALMPFSLSVWSEVAQLPISAGIGPKPVLPPPNPTWIPTVNIAPVKGWPPDGRPKAAPGIQVAAFARDFNHPRWLHVLPNGDVLVAETNSPPKPQTGIKDLITRQIMKKAGAAGPAGNRILLLRDSNGDGKVDLRTTFIEGLNSPFGMALIGDDFYVANADAVVRFPYRKDATQIKEPGVKVVDLPSGINHHWTKNLIASPDGSKLYVTVGSNSNIGENGMDNEVGRAAIWEVDVKQGGHRIFASGLRNPVGLGWEPQTGKLWTVVNERDELGSDLVPDYLTSVTDGGFYGWPYSYFGQHIDARVKPQRPELVAKAIVPDYALGPHTAALGLAFSEGAALPEPFKNGAFISLHGSWNRNPKSGYKVIFVPFRDGKPSGDPIDVLTGFLSPEEEAYGRPVGVAIDKHGALLVADDAGNTVWRVTK
jgi:glucose/arabinose dehydrogenase